MNEETLVEAGIDYQQGLNRFGRKKEIYEKYLKRLPQEVTFLDLENAMADEDYKKAFVAAHTLKGIVGNLSLNELLKALEPFVEDLRDGKDVESARKRWPSLQELYKKIILVIEGEQ